MNIYAVTVTPEWNKRDRLVFDVDEYCTFENILGTILRELEWDFDHLYEFYFDNGGTTKRQQIKRATRVIQQDVEPDVPLDSNMSMEEYERRLDEAYENQIYTHWPVQSLFDVRKNTTENFWLLYDFGDSNWFKGKIKFLRHEKLPYPMIRNKFSNTYPQYE